MVKATAKKELQIMFRYKANFIGMIVRAVIFIVIFWFFANALTFTNFEYNDKRSIFIFYLSAMVLMFYDGVALYGPVNTISRDLYNGTLESIYSLPTTRHSYFLGSVIANSLVSTFFVLPIFLFLIIYAKISLINLIAIIVVVLLTLSTLITMGILVSLMTILWKQTSSLVGIVGTLFQFVGGAIFPISSLPLILQYLARFFPYTWAFDLMRYYSFNGSSGSWTTILPVPIMWSILVLFTIGYTFLSKFLLKKVEKHAKNKGLHLL